MRGGGVPVGGGTIELPGKSSSNKRKAPFSSRRACEAKRHLFYLSRLVESILARKRLSAASGREIPEACSSRILHLQFSVLPFQLPDSAAFACQAVPRLPDLSLEPADLRVLGPLIRPGLEKLHTALRLAVRASTFFALSSLSAHSCIILGHHQNPFSTNSFTLSSFLEVSRLILKVGVPLEVSRRFLCLENPSCSSLLEQRRRICP